jgi:hypothetical protein
MLAGSASAQTSTTSGAGPGVVDPGHPRVNQVNGREENQQQRIGNGIKSGKLNSQQAANLEKRESSASTSRWQRTIWGRATLRLPVRHRSPLPTSGHGRSPV